MDGGRLQLTVRDSASSATGLPGSLRCTFGVKQLKNFYLFRSSDRSKLVQHLTAGLEIHYRKGYL